MLLVVAATAASVSTAPTATLTALQADLHGTRVTLTAHYKVRTTATVAKEVLPFDLPLGAVLTGATITGPGGTHRMTLERSERATARFDAATADEKAARGFAVMIDKIGGREMLSFATPSATTLELTLTIDEETCYGKDARYADLTEEYFALSPAKLRVAKARQGEVGERCTGSTSNGNWLAFPATELAEQPAGPDRIGATGQALVTRRGQIARIELATAGAIGDTPPDLATVILVDTSRSIGADARFAEAELAAAYLAAAPKSRVQVIGYARRADAMLPGWTDAREAAPEIRRLITAAPAANGSEIAVGLAAASDWLARTDGTKRIVVLTDDFLAARYGDRAQLAHDLPPLVAPGVIVHTVAVSPGHDTLLRDDAIDLADFAVATGGMSVRGGGPITALDATLLVHPISIDNLALDHGAWTPGTFEDVHPCNDTVAAGDACTWWLESPIGGPVTISGDIWGTHVTRVVLPDTAAGTSVARTLLAHESATDEIELAAHAVDARWSLVATWGGTGVYETGTESGDIGGSFADSSASSSSFSTHCGVREDLPHLDLLAQLQGAARACSLRDTHAAVTVETTGLEIVDVTVKLYGPDSRPRTDRSLSSCIESAVWNTMLVIPAPVPVHTHTTVEF